MIAVIAGASGLVGSHLITKLLEDPSIYSVISVSRRSLGLIDPKLKEILISDLTELSEMASQLKGDLYFCCLGTTIKSAGSQKNFRKVDFDAVVEFGKIAKSHSARSFTLISAAGADPSSLVFYNRVKGEAEGALKLLGLLQLVILRPGLLVGERVSIRPLERTLIQIYKKTSTLLPLKIKKTIATEVSVLVKKAISEGKKTNSGLIIIDSRGI